MMTESKKQEKPKGNRSWKTIKKWLLPVLAAVLVAVVVGCPIRKFTGIPCPGCGMTRAHVAMLHLDVGEAFYYHPLFWSAIPIVFYYGFKKGPFKKMDGVLIGIAAVLFLGVYIARVFVLHTEFLQIDLNSSVFYEIIKWVGGIISGK